MNRIRFALTATILLGSTYAAFGLIISLRDFGIGIAVAAAAMIGHGLLDFLQDHHHEHNQRRQEAIAYHPSTWWRDV